MSVIQERRKHLEALDFKVGDHQGLHIATQAMSRPERTVWAPLYQMVPFNEDTERPVWWRGALTGLRIDHSSHDSTWREWEAKLAEYCTP